MRYYLIAGEASGDLHGSNLVRRLNELDPDAQIKAWGGDLMAGAGADIIKHYRELAFMGFVEVIQNLKTIFKNLAFCKQEILSFRPDALILIDYPGFNLRIARWAKKNGFTVFYYISPQLWAWKPGRAKVIKSSVDQLYTILPFEKRFYEPYQVYPEYVGHPLLETVHSFRANTATEAQLKGKKVLALLPGSRRQEIIRILPILLQAATAFPDFTPVIAAAPALPITLYQEVIAKSNLASPIIIQNQTYTVLSMASLAWVSSGTATLETALFGVPQVVCYTGNLLSYHIAKRLVTIPYISLVNLILNKPLIPELIQHHFTKETLIQSTKSLDFDHIQSEYKHLNELLLPDNASYLVASSIYAKIKSTS